MTVKDFKRRFVRGLIAPELFLLPDPAESEQPQGDELIIEVTVAANASLNFGIYSLSGSTYTPYYGDSNIVKPSSGVPEIPYNWACWNPFSYIETEDGEPVTKENHPELFTDFPIHLLPQGKISENLIVKDGINLTVNWGDETVTSHTGANQNPSNITLNGTAFKVKQAASYCSNNISHTYAEAGTYTVKIKGSCPYPLCFPRETVRLISWGNLGFRSLAYMFQNCYNNIKSIAMPTAGELEHVTSISYMFGSSTSPINESVMSLELIKKLPKLVNASYALQYTAYEHIPDETFANHKYLTEIAYIFANCQKLIDIGDRVFYNCPNLLLSYGFGQYSSVQTIGDSLFENCEKLFYTQYTFYSMNSLATVGKNTFKNCKSITSVYYLVYGCLKLKSFGYGLFSGCPNIRNARYFLQDVPMLSDIPADLFADLRCSDNVTNEFDFQYWCYKYYSSSNGTMEEQRVHIGSNMFGNFFSQGGRIRISSQFISPATISKTNEYGASYTEEYSMFSGEVPDFWNHKNSVYYGSDAVPISVREEAGSLPFTGYYGRQAGTAGSICKNGGYDSFQYADNYSDIPQPSGRNNHNEENIWLYTTIWNDCALSITAYFLIRQDNVVGQEGKWLTSGTGVSYINIQVNGSDTNITDSETADIKIISAHGIDPLNSDLTAVCNTPRIDWIGTGHMNITPDNLNVYAWYYAVSTKYSNPTTVEGYGWAAYKTITFRMFDIFDNTLAQCTFHAIANSGYFPDYNVGEFMPPNAIDVLYVETNFYDALLESQGTTKSEISNRIYERCSSYSLDYAHDVFYNPRMYPFIDGRYYGNLPGYYLISQLGTFKQHVVGAGCATPTQYNY